MHSVDKHNSLLEFWLGSGVNEGLGVEPRVGGWVLCCIPPVYFGLFAVLFFFLTYLAFTHQK